MWALGCLLFDVFSAEPGHYLVPSPDKLFGQPLAAVVGAVATMSRSRLLTWVCHDKVGAKLVADCVQPVRSRLKLSMVSSICEQRLRGCADRPSVL